jgi:peptidoglycan glycosyltransferase
MASYPNFNPNTIEADWETLRTDDDASPLLNRATQGLYPPGSVFKMVTAAAAFSNLYGHDDFVFYCEGETTFGNKRIRCYNATAHGLVDANRAFAVSCNTYYAALIMAMGAAPLIDRTESMFFNERYPFPLSFTASSFVMGEDADEMELIDTAIGQGRTLVTPLHMAMLTAAAANGGLMMEPYVVNSIQSHNGATLQRNLPRPLRRVFTTEEAVFLTEIMTETVRSGTGQFAAVPGVAVGGKTGTAETDSGAPHGWFIAFAPAEMPQIAIAIVLENAGSTRRAQAMASEAIEIVLAANAS